MADIKELGFAEAEKVVLTKTQQQRISKMYSDLSKEALKKSKALPIKGTMSDSMRKSYLSKLSKELSAEVDKIVAAQNGIIREGMLKSAAAPVDATNAFMRKAGLDIKGSFMHVPTDVVNSLATGKVYEGKFNFSKALWKGGEKVKSDMHTVVAKGIASQKGTLDIAKDLEKYLDPKAKKDWAWKKVYPGTSAKVDYSAQRLARTLSQHAYQLSLMTTVKHNPFVSGIVWHSSNSLRTCEICAERDETVFDKTDLPLDHPNGMCYFTAEIPPLDQVSDRIADWANGKSDKALDSYALNSLGGKVIKKTTGSVVKEVVKAKVEMKYWDKTVGAFKKANYSKDELLNLNKSGQLQFIESHTKNAKKFAGSSVDEVKNEAGKLFDNLAAKSKFGDELDIGFGTTAKKASKLADEADKGFVSPAKVTIEPKPPVKVKPFNKVDAQNAIYDINEMKALDYALEHGFKQGNNTYAATMKEAKDFLTDLIKNNGKPLDVAKSKGFAATGKINIEPKLPLGGKPFNKVDAAGALYNPNESVAFNYALKHGFKPTGGGHDATMKEAKEFLNGLLFPNSAKAKAVKPVIIEAPRNPALEAANAKWDEMLMAQDWLTQNKYAKVGEVFDKVGSSVPSSWKYVDDYMPNFNKWHKNLTSEQYDGIHAYTSGGYTKMNKKLRGISKGNDSTTNKHIEETREALSKYKLEQDTLLRRGSDTESLHGLLGISEEQFDKADLSSFIGKVAEDKGFMSASPITKGGFASDGVEYRILAPKGTQGGYVAPISSFQNEQEILLNAGTRFLVKDIVPSEKYGLRVYLEVLVE